MKKIAIINSSNEIVEAFMLALNAEGYQAIGAHLHDFKTGRRDFIEFMRVERPDAVLIDIAPPYDSNWNFYLTMRSMEQSRGVPFVVTTTNERALREIIGDENADMTEILGKPFDIGAAIKKVETALESGA